MKRKLLALYLLAAPAAAAMLFTNWAVAQTADGSAELSESLVVQQAETVPPVDCSVDSGEVVALDTFNGATTADHTKLVTDLQSAGFTVRTVNTGVDGIPACIVKLIITTQAFNGCLTTLYPSALVDLIVSKVDGGLGLYLNNEWGPFCGPGTAPIANALSATWNGTGQNMTFSAGVNYLVGTPPLLFDGVNSWNWFFGSDYTAALGVVATTGVGNPAMIAKEHGSGCVVITGDSNYIADNWIDINDNRTLASNAIAYLNDCIIQRVKIDLKPGSNPNCVNPDSRGRVAVAIFGAPDFDVSEIDQTTLEFGGASVNRCSFEDALMEGPTGVFTTDGITDLVCHFATVNVDWPDRGTNCGTVELTGELLSGKKIEGSDIACIPGEATCEAGTPIPID